MQLNGVLILNNANKPDGHDLWPGRPITSVFRSSNITENR